MESPKVSTEYMENKLAKTNNSKENNSCLTFPLLSRYAKCHLRLMHSRNIATREKEQAGKGEEKVLNE
ncbi:unnamed protein product [Onchocerca flexuosa]|uniref:Ovule protein n=1 Tax=Onchocerca flexuosa TaxID=387005 RepID=A0A183I0I4_9BILA|nr:unnamed protein product [Onchocerca flexuosa]